MQAEKLIINLLTRAAIFQPNLGELFRGPFWGGEGRDG